MLVICTFDTNVHQISAILRTFFQARILVFDKPYFVARKGGKGQLFGKNSQIIPFFMAPLSSLKREDGVGQMLTIADVGGGDSGIVSFEGWRETSGGTETHLEADDTPVVSLHR